MVGIAYVELGTLWVYIVRSLNSYVVESIPNLDYKREYTLELLCTL